MKNYSYGSIKEIVGNVGAIQKWAPCDSCGCGGYWHGFDEPNQSCGNCGRARCAHYRRARRDAVELPSLRTDRDVTQAHVP